MRVRPVVGLLVISVVSVASAQSVIELPDKTVEVIGLNRWTIPMIQDSMAKYEPGVELTSHACAAVLRYKLGFADASSTTFAGFEAKPRLVVTVVEPQDSSRVRYRVVKSDTIATLPAYSDAMTLRRQTPWVAFAAIQRLHEWRTTPTRALRQEAVRRDSAAVLGYWRFLDAHRDPADLSLALDVMATDSNLYNRMVAVSITANFLDRDSTLWSLVEVLSESDGQAKGTAGVVLSSFFQNAPRQVDWSGAAPTLRDILRGTSLSNVLTVVEMLEKTGVGPDMAAPLLAGGGEMLLAYLGADAPFLRNPAHELLVALRGADLGEDPEVWRAWISTL